MEPSTYQNFWIQRITKEEQFMIKNAEKDNPTSLPKSPENKDSPIISQENAKKKKKFMRLVKKSEKSPKIPNPDIKNLEKRLQKEQQQRLLAELKIAELQKKLASFSKKPQ